MDGVIVDTAGYHYEAWRQLAEEMEYEFTIADNEQLKGLSRYDSLTMLLEMIGAQRDEQEKIALCKKKNDIYLSLVAELDSESILPGVLDMMDDLEQRSIPYAVGSASKNASPILQAVELLDRIETVIDGNDVERSKPDPEVFLKAADLIGADAATTLVIEDSIHGLRAARSGGFYTLGIGDRRVLHEADIVLPSLGGHQLQHIIDLLHEKKEYESYTHSRGGSH